MRTDLNELREIVMDEFSTDYGGGNIGLTPAGESLIALIDAELARPTDEDVESAIEELESACLCFDRHENCGGCPIEDRCWGKGKLKQAKETIKTALREAKERQNVTNIVKDYAKCLKTNQEAAKAKKARKNDGR